MKVKEGYSVQYAIQVTCREWNDGENSAMRAVWRDEPFDPRKLVREASECISRLQPDFVEKWKKRLEDVRDFAINMTKQTEAERVLTRAVKAALLAGLDIHTINRICSDAVKD